MTDPTPSTLPPLSERERIQALLDAGRISEADAELLFSALDDEEAGEEGARWAATEDASADTPTDDLAPPPPTPPAPMAPAIPLPPPPPGAVQGENTAWPSAAETGPSSTAQATPHGRAGDNDGVDGETGVRRWLKLAGGCGDLSVTVDPGLNEPTFIGEGVLEQQGADYLFRTPFDWKSTTADFAKAVTEGFNAPKPSAGKGGNWLSKLRSLGSSLKVRLPEGYGLELGVFAGDGTVRGVRALRGKFTGGDLTVDGAEHLDLTVTSGDVTLKVRPTRGAQRLRATSGDVTLTFLAGSDVTVSGKATAGDLDLPKGFSRGRGFGTTEIAGTLGAGRAQLELRLTAGDVNIHTEGGPWGDV